MDERIRATIPAKPEFVHILRSVTASVAARLDFPFDVIEDLRLAVDEACAQLLAIRPPASSLDISISTTGQTIEIVASADSQPRQWPPPGAQDGLAWKVLGVLIDEVKFETSDNGPSLILKKNLVGRSEGS